MIKSMALLSNCNNPILESHEKNLGSILGSSFVRLYMLPRFARNETNRQDYLGSRYINLPESKCAEVG